MPEWTYWKYQKQEEFIEKATLQRIIIRVFSLIALNNENKVDPSRAKKASCIQYGYRKSGTHALVFSQTIAHGKSKNGRRQRNRRREAEKNDNGKK